MVHFWGLSCVTTAAGAGLMRGCSVPFGLFFDVKLFPCLTLDRSFGRFKLSFMRFKLHRGFR